MLGLQQWHLTHTSSHPTSTSVTSPLAYSPQNSLAWCATHLLLGPWLLQSCLVGEGTGVPEEEVAELRPPSPGPSDSEGSTCPHGSSRDPCAGDAVGQTAGGRLAAGWGARRAVLSKTHVYQLWGERWPAAVAGPLSRCLILEGEGSTTGRHLCVPAEYVV